MGSPPGVALAVANSWRHRRGTLVDTLETPDEAADLLVGLGVLPDGTRLPDPDLDGFRCLRSAIRALLRARIDARAPEPAHLATLLAAAQAALGAPTVTWEGGATPVRGWRPLTGEPVDHARAAIAADAIDLLCGDDILSMCPAPGCVRIFVKAHHRRRWCSTRCGDRVRAARHYARRPDRPR